jgi:hypothetical protein
MKYHNKESPWKNEGNIGLTLKFKQSGIPFWKDSCNHPEESYIGSAIYSERYFEEGIVQYKDQKIDVYVFDNPSSQNVCIRYSNEPSEYISPGTLLDFLFASQREPTNHAYAAAALVINKYMKIRATKREEEPRLPFGEGQNLLKCS